MTPEAFALLVASCGIALPPGITAERLFAIAKVESGLDPARVSPPNRDGSRDYGLLQLNAQHIGKPGFPATAAEALRPCPNVAAGVRILADADRAAACIYNTGRPDCRRASGTNGYPERVAAASARLVRAERPAASPAAAPRAAEPQPEGWDVFAESAPAPDADTPDGEDDAAPSGEPPRVVVEMR